MARESFTGDELDELLLKCLEGTLDDCEFARVESLLDHDSTAREQFVELSMVGMLIAESRDEAIVSALASEMENTRPPVFARLIEISRATAEYLARPTSISVAAAAVVMVMVLGWLYSLAPPDCRPQHNPAADSSLTQPWVARVTRLVDARFSHGSQSVKPDEFLDPNDQLVLQKGLAEIKFASGARVVLEGPCTFRAEAANACRLDAGRLAALVTRRARGFTVTTSTVEIVDLGTEFGVQTAQGGETEVHVFRGEVAVRRMAATLPSDELILLTEDEARRFSMDRSLDEVVAVAQQQFSTMRYALAGVASRIEGGYAIHVAADPADTRVRDLATNTDPPVFDGRGDNADETSLATRRVGSFGASRGNYATEDDCLVFPFAMPAIDQRETITAAAFAISLLQIEGSPPFNVTLSGLARMAKIPTVYAEDYEAESTRLQTDFVTPATRPQRLVFGGQELVDFFIHQRNKGARAGDFVFLRLARSDGGALRGGAIPPNTAYEFQMADGPLPYHTPMLHISTAVRPNASARNASKSHTTGKPLEETHNDTY